MRIQELSDVEKIIRFERQGFSRCFECMQLHKPFAIAKSGALIRPLCRNCYPKAQAKLGVETEQLVEAKTGDSLPDFPASTAKQWVMEAMRFLTVPVRSRDLKRLAPYSEASIAAALNQLRHDGLAKLDDDLWSLTGKNPVLRKVKSGKRQLIQGCIYEALETQAQMNTAEITAIVNQRLNRDYCEKHVYEHCKAMVKDGRLGMISRHQQVNNSKYGKGVKHLYFRSSKQEEGAA